MAQPWVTVVNKVLLCCSFAQEPQTEGQQCLKMSRQVNSLSCFSAAHCWGEDDRLCSHLVCPCLQCRRLSVSRYWELWTVCTPDWSRVRSGPTATPWGTWGTPCRAHCSATSWPCSTPSNSSAARWDTPLTRCEAWTGWWWWCCQGNARQFDLYSLFVQTVCHTQHYDNMLFVLMVLLVFVLVVLHPLPHPSPTHVASICIQLQPVLTWSLYNKQCAAKLR